MSHFVSQLALCIILSPRARIPQFSLPAKEGENWHVEDARVVSSEAGAVIYRKSVERQVALVDLKASVG